MALKLTPPPPGDPTAAPPKNGIDKPKVKIIDSIPALLFAVASLGPFALPLLWRNPRFKRSTKVLVSVAVLVLTYLLTVTFGNFMKAQWDEAQALMEQMQMLRQQGN